MIRRAQQHRQRPSRAMAVLQERRGAAALEFAICGPIFLLLLFFVFEISYDLFLQECLNSALAFSARQMQIGTTQESAASGGNSFISAYLCPDAFGFLNCKNLYLRVEVINSSFTTDCTDLYQVTTGELPITNGVLQLGSFSSVNGAGIGTQIASTTCDSTAGQGVCNPTDSELVLLTAVYLGPSFLNGLLPGAQTYSYNGSDVRAQLASTAFQTEDFTPVTNPPDPCT
jgi:hypothetical protein